MTKILFLFVVLLTTAHAFNFDQIKDAIENEWNVFKTKYSKKFNSIEEDLIRFAAFRINREKVNAHNKLYEKGIVSNKLALNQFSDLLQNEVDAKMKGYKRSNQLWEPDDEPKPSENSIYFIEPFNLTLPRSIDWRDIGAVAEIKNQGVCGSCWSFSATGALEGQHFRKTGQLISLSEQNLIDCSSTAHNGCNGGFPDKALQYIKDNGGINTENAYPYKYGDDYFEYEKYQDKTCKYNATNVGAIVTGVVKIPTGDEQKLMTALATIGPISVAIDASGAFGFYHHSKGVYYNPNCATENENLDHAVLLVGYGTDANGKDYYIIKNSWGTSWGDGGFMKMARTGQNHCGIATDAYYPLV